MRISLRTKFMLWLVAQTALVYVAIAVPLYLFNLHERREHPGQEAEEREEFYIILGLMAGVFPVALAGAWTVSRELVRPLQRMAQTAESIRTGDLAQRIVTPVAHDEIGRLARTLNDAFDSYQRALQRLDRFSRDAAHQLRNPLAAIRTSAEVTLQQERTPAAYQEALGAIIEEARRLGHTVEQLLMLARLGRQDLREQFETVDLRALLAAVAETLAPAAEANEVQLAVQLPETPLRLRGLPLLLEQMVANLLDNAIRLTPPGGRVELAAQAAGGQITLTVSDTGPGLPATLQAQAVDQFGHFHGSPRDGAGLGLAIAAEVAQVHGGAITAANRPPAGACFTVTFRAAD